jgi:hypothetical protein
VGHAPNAELGLGATPSACFLLIVGRRGLIESRVTSHGYPDHPGDATHLDCDALRGSHHLTLEDVDVI